ncbi:hypothetical protein PYCCODRAFT_1366416, partial [Trametes coccinea BRFM310]
MGYRVGFHADGVTIRQRNGDLFFEGQRTPGSPLFALPSASGASPSAFLATRVPDLETWHRRLGHANYRATYTVASQAHAAGMPTRIASAPPKCDACILGKQTRSAVPKTREGPRSTVRGELFFVDPAGNQCTRSASGNIAPLDIVDDFSSYGWTFPVPSKDRCAPILRQFIIAR